MEKMKNGGNLQMKFKRITASDVINDQYYKLQKFLFTDEFAGLSLEAKVLYSILSDRNQLSIKNNFVDKNNDVYIICTNEEMSKKIGCGITKIIRIKKQLVEIGLITEKRQGLNKPNLIYVNNIVSDEEYNRNFQNENSKVSDCETQDFSNVKPSKTEISKTEINNLSIYQIEEQKTDRSIDFLNNKFEVDTFANDKEYQSLVFLIGDVLNSSKKVKVNGELKPIELVKAVFSKLEIPHLQYVLEQLNGKTDKINNPRSYLISSLYNSLTTIDLHYRNEMNTEFSGTKQLKIVDDSKVAEIDYYQNMK